VLELMADAPSQRGWRGPAVTPEWDRVTVKSGADQRKLFDDDQEARRTPRKNLDASADRGAVPNCEAA
jgi:predicted DNA-binding WGR domain protein